MSSAPEVAVCIPTCRRPQGLEKLLDEIALLDIQKNVIVIVADNDAEKAEGFAVFEQRLKQGYRFALEGLVVAERGISEARNALVRQALKHPTVRFIAMIDDDEWPRANWLSALLAAQEATGADILGGPVSRIFEAEVSAHYTKAETVKSKSAVTSRIRSIEATSNIMFRTEVFLPERDQWFDPAFSLTGGGDRDFLLGERLKGRTFAWAADALVYETMPASRCTEKWSIQRSYRVGNSEMIAYLKHRPPNFVLKEFVKVNLALLESFVYFLPFWSKAARFHALRTGARAVGKITALGGTKYYEYKTIHGS